MAVIAGMSGGMHLHLGSSLGCGGHLDAARSSEARPGSATRGRWQDDLPIARPRQVVEQSVDTETPTRSDPHAIRLVAGIYGCGDVADATAPRSPVSIKVGRQPSRASLEVRPSAMRSGSSNPWCRATC